MTTSARKKRQTDSGAANGLADVAALNGAMLSAFAKASQAYVDGLVAMNEEMMSFANDRMHRNAELGERLTKCGTWGDVLSLQQDWSRAAMEAYSAETAKLTELATKVQSESWAPLAERAAAATTQER